jgi:hypothetical protein
MTVIDQILNEWSFRCHDGIVDMNDPKKVAILNEILKEYNLVLKEKDKVEYSNTLNVREISKERKGRYRGDIVVEFIKKRIPFTLKDGDKKILDFINDEIQNIFNNHQYNKLSKNQNIFVDEDDNEYKLEDIVKTDAFGGQEKGFSTKHETSALNELDNQIKNILSEENLDSIKVQIGDTIYDDIIGAQNQPNTPKSDFNLINNKKKNIVFISHKKEGGSKSFVRWGGLNFAYKEENPEILKFIENINSKISNKEFEKKYNFSQKISSDLLKKRIVFGKDFKEESKNFGIDNVQIVVQGKVFLEKIKNSLYKLKADEFWLNGELPTGDYEPVFNAHYRDGYNQLGFKNCEVFSMTINTIPSTSITFPAGESDEEWQPNQPTRKAAEKPSININKQNYKSLTSSLTKEKEIYISRQWVKDHPEYKKYFDNDKSHPLYKDFILLKPDADIELNPIQE